MEAFPLKNTYKELIKCIVQKQFNGNDFLTQSLKIPEHSKVTI